MKKQIISIIAAAVAAAMLAACGTTPPASADTQPEPTSTGESSGQSTIDLPVNAAAGEADLVGDGAPNVTNLDDAGLPSEAILFPEAEWNDMGGFIARLIGYVETTVDPSVHPEDFPKDNKFFGLFWQLDSSEPDTFIDGDYFGLGGPGVAVVSAVLEQRGDITSSCLIQEPHQPGYVYTLITAEKLEDITQVWYRNLEEDKDTGELEYAYHYATDLPIGSLIVNEKPEGFDYTVPPSATAMVGEWSDTSTGEETIKMRTIALDTYPMPDSARPDFMTPGQKLYVLYLEVRNEGEQDIEFTSVLPGVKGKGVQDNILFWGNYNCTGYGTNYSHSMPKGATDVVYTMFVANDFSDITELHVSQREDTPTLIPISPATPGQSSVPASDPGESSAPPTNSDTPNVNSPGTPSGSASPFRYQ